MRKLFFRTLLYSVLLAVCGAAHAQDENRVALYPDEQERLRTAPLPEIEAELAAMGQDILNHPVGPYKDYVNGRFILMLSEVLKRADSYAYPFAGIKTVSRIYPEDECFRLFTWVLVDQDSLQQVQNYYHFGLVQRPIQQAGAVTYAVVVLNDRVDRTPTIENEILNPTKWLGALYYHPKNSDYGVLTYQGKYAQKDGMSGKMRQKKVRYYVVLGYNGHNRQNNYKIIDCITFPDAEDPLKIEFGAPIFYFSEVPKSRCVFKYSDNTHFSLNLGQVRDPRSKRLSEMLIFDHLQSNYLASEDTNSLAVQQERRYGPAGDYDALAWIKRVHNNRKGFFYLLKEVDVYHPQMEQLDPDETRKQAERDRQQLIEQRALPAPKPAPKKKKIKDKPGR
ncbi:MAG: hypothetical protein ACK5QE_03625 [Sphingobacteriia bacterium]|jgi:hypothetical protein